MAVSEQSDLHRAWGVACVEVLGSICHGSILATYFGLNHRCIFVSKRQVDLPLLWIATEPLLTLFSRELKTIEAWRATPRRLAVANHHELSHDDGLLGIPLLVRNAPCGRRGSSAQQTAKFMGEVSFRSAALYGNPRDAGRGRV